MREENLTKRNIYINLFPRITIYLYNFFFLIKFHIKKKKKSYYSARTSTSGIQKRQQLNNAYIINPTILSDK